MPKITIDVPMPIRYVSRELLDQMELLRPFGKGNSRPLFAEKRAAGTESQNFWQE